jgi:hypothetical protein
MVTKIALIAGLLVGLTWYLATGHGAHTVSGPGQPAEGAGTVPVLVELFTSEGCSSCPPADELLMRLEKEQPVAGARIIALSEHVDYWNRLGWTDPYSSHAFSERQSRYATALSTEGAYTPQMIVDGKTEFVGSNQNSARAAIEKAAQRPKSEILLSTGGTVPAGSAIVKVAVQAPGLAAAGPVDILLAITEDGLLSNVSRGENAGRKLEHTAVTRRLITLGSAEPGRTFKAEQNVSLETSWRRDHLRAVVFAQERATRAVVAAADVSL